MVASQDELGQLMLPSDSDSRVALERLVSRLSIVGVCALVGAGVSVGVGFPTWTELLDELGSQLKGIETSQVRNMLAVQQDFLWRAEEYRQRMMEDRYRRFLRQRFGPRGGTVPQLVQDLVKLNFKHILTTNYDTTLQQAHFVCFGEPASELDWTDRDSVRIFLGKLADLDTPRLYSNLHGRYDRPEHIVLTYRDYVSRYIQSDEMVQKLFVLFATQQIVFVGFSLEDPDFVQILRLVNSRLGKGEQPAHFAILPAESSAVANLDRRRLQGKYDVDPIFYLHRAGDRHQNLAQLFALLNNLQASPTLRASLLGGSSSESESIPEKSALKMATSADPQKSLWGGQATRNGRELSADVMVAGNRWYEVQLKVTGKESNEFGVLSGKVIFHLHNTFNPSIETVSVENSTAVLTLHAYGAFTVGVECDDGKTQLELDLSEIDRFPETFREA